MNEGVKIDSNIPVPVVRGKYSLYPWQDLKPGQSFLVTAMDGSSYCGLTHYAKRYAEKVGGDIKFVVKKMPDGIRVWRTK